MFWEKLCKMFIFIFVFSLALNIIPVRHAFAAQPDILGSYGVSIDAYTGDVLYDKKAKEQAYPASVTKVMTALLLMENVKEGEKITFSQNAINQVKSNSKIEFKVGEQINRENALNVMMILSANDVAVAIAEHISGSEKEFADLMNARAKELGAENTHFVSPNGLHHPEHKTTAYDMALITKEAIKNEVLLKAMGTKTATIKTSSQSKEVTNPSKIHDDPESIGGKTGFTNQARNTLIKVDERDGKRVINVIFGANSKTNKYNIYPEIKKMSNFAMEQLETVTVVDSTKWSKTLTLLDKKVLVKAEKTLKITQKKNNDSGKYKLIFIQKEELDDNFLYIKGITKGSKVGELEVRKNNKLISKVDVVSTEDVFFEKEKQAFIPFWLKVILAVFIPAAAYIGFIFAYNYKHINRRKPV